jgi:two-component system osmolarity sensor histidine kinase EnvZ
VRVWADAPPGALARVRPGALKRALTNLVANAVSHATQVEIRAHETLAGGVQIHIDDDGPGIAPDRYDDAFAPFSRLDTARDPNTKGVGLGLAIARDVARGHGGDVTLSPSPLGGLRATVTLP